MTNSEPEAILARIARGEPDAVETCLDRYGDLVWSLARRHTYGTDEAEDAVQDIFLDLWKSAGRYDSRLGSEVTFVCTVARRRLIDRSRYRQRRPQPESLVTPEGDMRDLTDPRESSQSIEAQADAALAVRAMSLLEPREREVVRLSVVAGMSHSEIARHTDLPLGTVKTYIRRSLIRIHEHLNARAARAGAARP